MAVYGRHCGEPDGILGPGMGFVWRLGENATRSWREWDSVRRFDRSGVGPVLWWVDHGVVWVQNRGVAVNSRGVPGVHTTKTSIRR